MFSRNDVAGLRAEERMGSAINAGQSFGILAMDIFAMKSKNKVFKTVAWIITIIEAIDKIRLIVVNLNARKSMLELIDDEDEREAAKQGSSFTGLMQKVNTSMKYQFTGKID